MVAGRGKEAGPSRVGAGKGRTARTRSCLVGKLECLEDGGRERKGRKKEAGPAGRLENKDLVWRIMGLSS